MTMNLEDFLKFKRDTKAKTIELFFDIETYQYNELAGYESPSQFKNQVFAVVVSYIHDGVIYGELFPNFMRLFDVVEAAKLSVKTKVSLIAHNSNKYDNHYLLMQLLHHYNPPRYPYYMRQAENNDYTETFNNLKLKKGDQVILEKRVKSKSNLELQFTLGTVKYQTIDFYPKANMSIKTLGDRMLKMRLIDEDHLKTKFDYLKYNLDNDLSYNESILYAYKIFDNLTPEEKRYIFNDGYILAKAYSNFSQIFPGFDVSKITFSQNVLDEYKVNSLAEFQLTGKAGPFNLNYSEFDFKDMNFSDYLKFFYKGGLNIYNDKYVGKLINRPMKSYDLNSSYPNVMYNSKIPTYLLNVCGETQVINRNTLDIDHYYLFEISVDEFNRLISFIPSEMIRKSLVKYYSTYHPNVYINSNTLKLIDLFAREHINEFEAMSVIEWETREFGAKEVIAENYFVKTQGKNKHKLIMNSPSDFIITEELNTRVYSPEEINNSKVTLNGIYGLPALRANYHLFKYNPELDMIESFPNSFKNTERNMIFSIFVTSQALLNLLTPLASLSPEEIDDYWYYADTDSIYVDAAIDDKVDHTLFNNLNLGYWKKEHNIIQFYILNHKKYAFVGDGKNKDGGINIRSGGVNQDQFNTDMSFEEFINTQFSDGVTVKSLKSVLTNEGTMALYNSDIALQVGTPYIDHMTQYHKQVMKTIAENLKNDIIEDTGDALTDAGQVMYVETPFGTLSVNEITQELREKGDRSVDNLISGFGLVRRILED